MTNRRVFVPVLLAAAVLAVPAAALAAAGPAPGSAARAAQPAAARPANGLGQKPYMGWSSWSLESTRFPGYNGESFITEANVKKMSNVMASKLQAFGYTYVNIDSGWSNGFDSFGRPRADSGKFPDGIAAVASYVHAKGQKLGIYYIGGLNPSVYDRNSPIQGTACHARDIAVQPLTKTNSWMTNWAINWSNPCAQAYINSIANQFASWGVDFLKLDGITPTTFRNIGPSATDGRGDVKAWSQALIQTGRPIWLTISWSIQHDFASYWKQYANGIRVDTDVECYCNTIVTWDHSVKARFKDLTLWAGDIGPGTWADMDSVDVGVGAMDGITNDERQTVMTFWAAESAPLYSGDDLTKLDSFGLSLLTNTEVIAVDQAARPARPVSTSTSQQVWAAHNPDGSVTVALFNLGSSTATVTAKWSDLGLSGSAAVRDLWSHTALGSFTGSFSASLPKHGSRLLRVTPRSGGATTSTLVNQGSGRCLDDPGANTTDGTHVIIWDCHGVSNQQWTVSGHQLQVLGKCLAAPTAVIATCDTSAIQQWNVNADGTVTAVASGLCLDVTGTANSPVKVATCTGAPSQHWRRV